MQFWKASVELTMKGASGEVRGIFEDDPMCMHRVVAVSSHAANTRSHAPVCNDGKPRAWGLSGKVTAKLPLAAHRQSSSVARSASQSGRMVNGMSRPRPGPAHHSSMIQSLYART